MPATFNSFVLFLLLVVASVFATPLERRHPADFALVAETSNPAYNGKVLGIDGSNRATLTGGAIAKVYLNGVRLSADVPGAGNTAVINSIQGASGCSAGGELQFAENYSTNKCAKYQPFTMLSQGRRSYLAFNGSRTFYVCGGIVSWNDVNMPGCSPVKLYRK